MKSTFALLTAIGVCLLASCGTRGGAGAGTATPPQQPTAEVPPKGPAWLADVTAQTGIDFTYQSGEEADRFTILESLGGGVAIFDYDRDGWQDVFLAGGGRFDRTGSDFIHGLPGKLYRNLGGWKFADTTAAAGLDATPFYSHGCLAGDFDNDSWPDLLVTGFGGMRLYHNRPADDGGRRFDDVTQQVGLTDPRWCTSAAWGDLSGQGRADLYVCRYVDWSPANDPLCTRAGDPQTRDVCPPQKFQPLPHSLYRHDGAAFTDVAAAVPLADGKGLGVVLADLNDDARPDLYVVNDAGDNRLYLNRGQGKFDERGVTAGVAVDDHGRYNGSMGVDAGDYDNSGRPSLWVTNFQNELHALYLNVGNETFLYQSQAAGLGALGQQYVAFGTSLVDFDNDSWLDLVFVNGHVLRHPVAAPFRQKPVLLQNVEKAGRRFFQDISPQGGSYFAAPALGRGLAVGDLDNDGWPDLVVSHCNTPIAVLRNVAGEAQTAHWLGIELVGRNNRPIAGATIRVQAGGRTLTRFAKSGASYLSSSDPRILFGLGQSPQIEKITVHWPWGEQQQWDGKELAIDRYWQLVEGENELR